MISLKPTRERLANHFSYYWKFYLIICVVFAGVLDIVFLATRPLPKKNEVVNIHILTEVGETGVANLEADLLSMLPLDQKEVNVLSTAPFGVDSYQFALVVSTKLSAGEGDIYILPDTYMSMFSDAASDLTPYIDDGTFVLPEGVDIRKYETDGTPMVEGADPTEPGILFIPLEKLPGLGEFMYTYDNMTAEDYNLVLCITNFTENKENAVKCVQWILNNKTVYTPEKVTDLPQ